MCNLAAFFGVLFMLRHTISLSHSLTQTMAFRAILIFSLCFISFTLNSVYGTLPNPIRSTNSPYRNHPGKIEDFTPGHSSATDKERREVRNFFFFCSTDIKLRHNDNIICMIGRMKKYLFSAHSGHTVLNLKKGKMWHTRCDDI